MIHKTLFTMLERKRLPADGSEPTSASKQHGLTIPRPVDVKTITPIGKEIIVDVSEAPNELMSEELSKTETLLYKQPTSREVLYEKIRALGVRNVATETGIDAKRLSRILTGKAKPRDTTIECFCG
jgi:hypothetical protein